MDAFDKPTLVFRNGVHLLGTMVWFDPTRASEFCAVSSAAQPRLRRHQRVLWSDRTARLEEQRRGFSLSGLACPYRHSFNLGPLVFELIPSGFMPGACQFLLRFPNGYELLYSGPVSVQQSLTAEAIEYGQCDTLVLDATYGHPSFVFPERESVYADIKQWVAQTRDNGETPLLLVSNPGKAQDLIALLGTDTAIRTHRSIRQFNSAYRAIDVDIPRCGVFQSGSHTGEVVIWPKHLAASPALQRLKNVATAVVSGTPPSGSDGTSGATHFPWSGRADFNELATYARQWKPKMVLTVGKYATGLARALTDQGMHATPLLETVQMPLDL